MKRFPLPLRLPLLLALLLVAGCAPGPRDIAFDKENCAQCAMTISDRRFAGELVTKKGKVYVFDAIECAASFIDEHKVEVEEVEQIWMTDFSRPGTLVNGAKAWYLRSDSIASPMGLHLAAFEQEAAFKDHQRRLGGDELRWIGLRLYVAKEGLH